MAKEKTYSRKQVIELIEWYREAWRGGKIPTSLRLDDSTFIEDTNKAIPNLIYLAKIYATSDKETYRGHIIQLLKIKEIISR